jgi:hypothetical protein
LNFEGIFDAAVQFSDFARFLNAERITECVDVTILLFLNISLDLSRSPGIEDS